MVTIRPFYCSHSSVESIKLRQQMQRSLLACILRVKGDKKNFPLKAGSQEVFN